MSQTLFFRLILSKIHKKQTFFIKYRMYDYKVSGKSTP